MDKTYNDLMDIVNRTKKIDEAEGRTSRPRTIIKTQSDESTFGEQNEVVKPAKTSLFEGKDAINKYLSAVKEKKKKSVKKETQKKATTKKGKKSTKSTSTKATKKSTTRKSATKNTKANTAKNIADKMKLINDKTIVRPKKQAPVLDMNDPKNVELYNALQETLLAGGTDVSEYMNTGVSAKKLNELFAKKKAQKVNNEITKEQQEYEKLFNGSFMGAVEDAENENNENVQEGDISDDKLQEILARNAEREGEYYEGENETPSIENEEPQESVSGEQNASENSENSGFERRNRFDIDLEEMNNRDRELDEKIADYYKRKQEKINAYNEKMAEDFTEEKHEDVHASERDYEEIFNGQIEKRSEVLGVEEEPKVEEVEEEKEKDFQTIYRELNDESFEDDDRFVTPASEKPDGEVFVSEKANEDTDQNIDIQTQKTDENNQKQSFEDEELVESELSDVDYSDYEQSDDKDIYDLSDEDSDLDDYIVSSNVPIETNNQEDEDSTMVINASDLPENKICVLEEKADEEEEKDSDAISKQEFYDEMARLQENLINQLKGEGTPKEQEKDEKPSENSTLDKALDIISNLTQRQNEPSKMERKAEIVANELVDELTKDMQLKNIIDGEDESVTEETENNQEENVSEKKEEDYNPEFDKLNLLNKDVALNDDDLEYIVNSEKQKNEKPAYFYMSEEDKKNKAEMQAEISSSTSENTGKEMGDLNLNKDIANAVSLAEQSNKTEENSTPEPDDMEVIYTIFGMQKKKMEKDNKEIKVLYVASECQPFCATGGLGDVAGSLPKAISKLGDVDIRVIMPLYGKIKYEYADKLEYIGNFTVHLSWRQEYCGLFKYTLDGVTYYFIDNERYFKRNAQYGFYDDGERFAYFCKAIVESLPMLNFFPDIIHCNDWQSALVSTYIKTGNWSDFRYYKIKNLYTIHNVEYQGVYGMENLKDLFGIDNRFKNDMEYNGDINLTKAAIQFSDKFTTVSESYCDNLKQPYCSKGLHHIIIRNAYKLSGIINGIDYDFYNPKTDSVIYKNYDADTIEDKVYNKKIWQDELGLPVDAKTPMLAIVSRLVSHKGIDLLSKVLEDVLTKDVQLVIVGTGDQRFIDYFKYLENKYPTKVRALVDKYSLENARKAYASSDIFLMPSKVEPCGISQMIASRYGSVPVVREVGGLKDSIKDFGCEGGGNGYTFANYNPDDLKNQIMRAINDYHDEAEWKKKMKKIMTIDFSWSKSAQKYVDLYRSLID